MFANLDATIIPELKLEQDVIAMSIGMSHAIGPNVLAARLCNSKIFREKKHA